ncbi:hypothetical protein [Streptomyces sp. NPDC058145]|uniref:hypothetical protein n=1 Tax=Streptomyces sp. NPDC058145 TaxID=3346356 RepID=UPI0036EE0D1C
MENDAVLAEALWRAICYASVCQLHQGDNVLLNQPLTAEHVKERPSGHWGTVPGTAFALTHLALAAGALDGEVGLVPLLGAGHAGVVQLSAFLGDSRVGQVAPGIRTGRRRSAAALPGFP